MTPKEFILLNKGKMRVKDIASHLGCTPAYVCKINRGVKAKVVKMEGYFDLEDFKKHYTI